MKNKLVLITISCLTAMSLCACNVSFSKSSTTTTTTTTTDSKGNTTTVTTISETTTGDPSEVYSDSDFDFYPDGSCGAAAEDGEEHTVSVTIENATGEDITALYCCPTDSEEWMNQFEDGDVLGDGESLDSFLELPYTYDSLSYDFGIKGPDGELQEFNYLDISDFDEYGFTIVFNKTDGEYGMHIDAEYVMG